MVARKSLSIEEVAVWMALKRHVVWSTVKSLQKNQSIYHSLMSSAQEPHSDNQWWSFSTQVQNLVIVTVCNLHCFWALLNASNKLGEKWKGHSSSSFGQQLLCHFFCVAFTADTFSLCQKSQLNAARWRSKYVFTLKLWVIRNSSSELHPECFAHYRCNMYYTFKIF